MNEPADSRKKNLLTYILKILKIKQTNS